MNEEIIRMVREASDPDKVDPLQNGFWVLTQEELERFTQLATAHEREACAQIADKYHVPMLDTVADIIGAKIRARGKR